MPQPAARVTDMHVCPMVTGLVPHVGGPILPPGCPTVLIGGLPAARVGDMATCAGPPDVIVVGAFTVLVGGQPAARMADQTAHGGMIAMGFPTVLIGESGSGGAGVGGGGAPVVAQSFADAAAGATPLVCKGPCEACGHLAPAIQQITPTRKKGDAGFDEAKMYKIFKKSKTATALESEVTKTGYKYAGDVADPKLSAYTDVANKEIRIRKSDTEEEAALAYAYELQNAKNGPKYNQIFADAKAGTIKDKKEFANRIMEHEVEALETEAKVADEMGIKPPPNKDVYDIVKDNKDETERRKKIREWADNSGQIGGKNPTEHYEQMYEDDYGKKKP